MFGTLESTWDHSFHRRWTALASFIMQLIGIGLLLLLPILTIPGPPILTRIRESNLAPPPGPAPAMPVERPSTSSNFHEAPLQEPQTIPDTITNSNEPQIASAPNLDNIAVMGATHLGTWNSTFPRFVVRCRYTAASSSTRTSTEALALGGGQSHISRAANLSAAGTAGAHSRLGGVKSNHQQGRDDREPHGGERASAADPVRNRCSPAVALPSVLPQQRTDRSRNGNNGQLHAIGRLIPGSYHRHVAPG